MADVAAGGKPEARAIVLNARERTAFAATFCGWMLDGMDVMIFSFVLPTLLVLWHLSPGQAGWLATATLIVSSAGGWLAGMLADRFGRVPILQLTICWFALFTFLSGFTHSYPQLLVTRALQGLGFGGEWAIGAALMGETVRPEWRGRVVGWVQSGWAIGWAIAAAAYAILFSFLPAELAWRVLFFLGLLPALLVIYIRRRVTEPEGTVRTQRWTSSAFEIFTPALARTTLLASLASVGAQGGYYTVNTWLPLYLKNVRHLSVLSTSGYLAVVIAGAFLGYLTSAQLTDKLGRRRTLILFAAGSFATVWLYTRADGTAAFWLGFPIGFFPSGTFSPMGSFFAELFPTVARGSGQGFVYNVGRGVGALFPALVGILSGRLALATAIAFFALAAYGLMTAAVLLLPETRGRVIT